MGFGHEGRNISRAKCLSLILPAQSLESPAGAGGCSYMNHRAGRNVMRLVSTVHRRSHFMDLHDGCNISALNSFFLAELIHGVGKM